MTDPLVLGLDLGTGGVRALVARPDGRVVAQTAAPLAPSTIPGPGRHEQSPHDWWRAVQECLAALGPELARCGAGLDQLCGLAVDGTSGTLVALDRAGNP